MQFLHVNECAEWCREHGATITDPWTLITDPSLEHTTRVLFAPEGSLGLEPQVATSCLNVLGAWDACLLCVTAWGIWPSIENWPAYYALRGARNEPADLHNKPGHLFAVTEAEDLHRFLLAVLTNGWDAHLLPASGSRIDRRLWVSHDGWAELHTAAPTAFELTAV